MGVLRVGEGYGSCRSCGFMDGRLVGGSTRVPRANSRPLLPGHPSPAHELHNRLDGRGCAPPAHRVHSPEYEIDGGKKREGRGAASSLRSRRGSGSMLSSSTRRGRGLWCLRCGRPRRRPPRPRPAVDRLTPPPHGVRSRQRSDRGTPKVDQCELRGCESIPLQSSRPRSAPICGVTVPRRWRDIALSPFLASGPASGPILGPGIDSQPLRPPGTKRSFGTGTSYRESGWYCSSRRAGVSKSSSRRKSSRSIWVTGEPNSTWAWSLSQRR